MSQTQIKVAELRAYSCNRWGLAFFAVMVLAASGVVGRYLQVEKFDIVFWAGITIAVVCGGIALYFGLAEDQHITSLEKHQQEEKSDA